MTKEKLAKRLLERLDFKTWTKNTYARNEKNKSVSPLSAQATKWCVAGLACKIARRSDVAYIPAWGELTSDFCEKYDGRDLVRINDEQGFKTLKKMLSNLY